MRASRQPPAASRHPTSDISAFYLRWFATPGVLVFSATNGGAVRVTSARRLLAVGEARYVAQGNP